MSSVPDATEVGRSALSCLVFWGMLGLINRALGKLQGDANDNNGGAETG